MQNYFHYASDYHVRLQRAHYFRAHHLVSWAHGLMAHRLDLPPYTSCPIAVNIEALKAQPSILQSELLID